MLVKKFSDINISDIASVGSKNASLGEMYSQLTPKGVRIPNGFATTSEAFWMFLKENKLQEALKNIVAELDRNQFTDPNLIGERARSLILKSEFSDPFSEAIGDAYNSLGRGEDKAVTVHISVTTEDVPHSSIAGQNDILLNISGKEAVLEAVKNCFAWFYTDRAIKYRSDEGFLHEDVALSVGVQLQVRSDIGCSGVGFTIEPRSGFGNVMLLLGVWGLSENIVKGKVSPDEFYVFKPSLRKMKLPIIHAVMGNKKLTMVYASEKEMVMRVNVDTSIDKQQQYVLSIDEIITLGKWALLIEEHYQKPMDIDWAKDGITNELFITQASPETVNRTTKNKHNNSLYSILRLMKLSEKQGILRAVPK